MSRRCAATFVFWRAIFWKVVDRDRAGTSWLSITLQLSLNRWDSSQSCQIMAGFSQCRWLALLHAFPTR